MSGRIQRRQLLVAAGLGLLWRSVARAQEETDPIAGLLALSDCCVVGRPVAGEASWIVLGGARRIVTLHEVRVDEVLAGAATPGEPLRVRTLGGRVGNVAQRVFGEAELAREQPALLFLARVAPALHVVADMAGGCYPIENDASGMARLRASVHTQLHGRTLVEARRLLSAAVRGARAR